LPLISDFASEYAIKKIQESQVGLKLNGTRQFLAYSDDVNLLRNNIDTIKKNTESLNRKTKPSFATISKMCFISCSL
jgi:hypothetical protein